VAKLDARTRAKLPDGAFAYIDSRGNRRLPINDAPHVRNALARFNQVAFESDAARDQARLRLLRAAQRHGVVPIGFISAQLQPHRRLPTGTVTFLLADVERSTELLERLGDGYASVVASIRRVLRTAVRRAGGHEVDARGDELFAAFADAAAALEAAVAAQREIRGATWPDGAEVKMRMALHTGRPTLTESGYVGLAVHATARFCYCAHGGQIVVSAATRAAALDAVGDRLSLHSLGSWRFQGLRDAEELYQLDADGLVGEFPPPRAATRA
jgi:class 3 adenylate cyclase